MQFLVLKQWDQFVVAYFAKDLTGKDKFFSDFIQRFSSLVWQVKDSLVKNFLVTSRVPPKLHSLQHFALLIQKEVRNTWKNIHNALEQKSYKRL
jgi:hypothetical protein